MRFIWIARKIIQKE